MKEKTRFIFVAGVAFLAGVIVASAVNNAAYKQDLEFLGMAYKLAQDTLAELRTELGE